MIAYRVPFSIVVMAATLGVAALLISCSNFENKEKAKFESRSGYTVAYPRDWHVVSQESSGSPTEFSNLNVQNFDEAKKISDKSRENIRVIVSSNTLSAGQRFEDWIKEQEGKVFDISDLKLNGLTSVTRIEENDEFFQMSVDRFEATYIFCDGGRLYRLIAMPSTSVLLATYHELLKSFRCE